MRIQRELAELAGRQHGVVAARQAAELGWSASAIARMERSGRLHRIHQGVYAVGHPAITSHGRAMAAVLACGSGAVLSHWSAGWLWGFVPAIGSPIDVTAAAPRKRRESIRTHSASTLRPADRTSVEGVAVTAVPATFLGIAESTGSLGAMLGRADRLGLLDVSGMDELLARRRGARGVARLRSAVDEFRRPVFTRSGLERSFLALVEEGGLPLPESNVSVEGFELDAYWPELRFAVELDSYEYHRDQRAFESDRERQDDLKLAGIEMIRLTDRRIATRPRAVQLRLRRHLLQRHREINP